jgi:MoaA/NifB/PqqE/SkfB family radical SAM enzyme
MNKDKTYFYDKFSPYKNKMIWQINNSCNYRCEYCFSLDLFEPVTKHKYSNEFIAENFNKTNTSWLIVITGGEPFLHDDFIGLLELLTKKHTVAFSSNFSSKDIYRLTEIKNSKNLLLVNASAHFEYRNSIKTNFDDFIEKVLFLQNNRIPVLVSHVAYPPFIEKTAEHIRFLKSKGIHDLSVLAFRSNYNGYSYPENYSSAEIDFIDNNSIDSTESLIARKQTDFYGHYCEAGRNFFFMDYSGNVMRCGSIHKKLGNLFENTFSQPFDNKLNPCTVHDCVDCYLGFLSVKDKKAGKIRMMGENFKKTIKIR